MTILVRRTAGETYRSRASQTCTVVDEYVKSVVALSVLAGEVANRRLAGRVNRHDHGLRCGRVLANRLCRLLAALGIAAREDHFGSPKSELFLPDA